MDTLPVRIPGVKLPQQVLHQKSTIIRLIQNHFQFLLRNSKYPYIPQQKSPLNILSNFLLTLWKGLLQSLLVVMPFKLWIAGLRTVTRERASVERIAVMVLVNIDTIALLNNYC